MVKNLIKKTIELFITIFVISFVVFCMSRLSPGDPLRSYYGDSVQKMSATQKEVAIEKLGLNEPILVQYKVWLTNAIKGEFGMSYKYKQDALDVINKVAINTVLLGGVSYILTFVIAILLAVFCAINEDNLIDKLICKLGVITNCIPSFWISLILILIFSVNLKLLPSSGAYAIGQENNVMSRISHLILPVTVLVISHLWYYTYMIRNKLVEELREDYFVLCKAKGMSTNYIIFNHCIRNIMPSLVSVMTLSIPHILAGTYIVEQVFSYPGLGSLCFESAKYHDYNMLMLLCIITGALVVVSSMIGEFIIYKVDPRTSEEEIVYDEEITNYEEEIVDDKIDTIINESSYGGELDEFAI